MGIKFGKLFKSVEENVVPEDVVSESVKRKAREDDGNPQRKCRRLDSIPSDNELPSISRDTESSNAPEVALNAKRKAVAHDGPVQRKKRTLDPSTMFKSKYKQQKKLGEGGYGSVYAGYRKADRLAVAIKHIPIDRNVLKHEDENGVQIPMEVAVMRKLAAESKGHPAYAYLLDWYVLGQELVLVMERPTAAVDLHHHITARGGCIEEREAKIITRQLVDAALDLQQKQIFHRDIKLNNILIETGSDEPRVHIIDFGVSCFCKEGDRYDFFYGYQAPPEWKSRLEYRAGPTTVYQIGVVLFDMLQNPAFEDKVYHRQIIKCWFSENCRDFFKGCIHTNPEQRLTLEQLRNHLWLR